MSEFDIRSFKPDWVEWIDWEFIWPVNVMTKKQTVMVATDLAGFSAEEMQGHSQMEKLLNDLAESQREVQRLRVTLREANGECLVIRSSERQNVFSCIDSLVWAKANPDKCFQSTLIPSIMKLMCRRCRVELALTEGAASQQAESRCRAGSDGDCVWLECPQLRDDEPEKSNRNCPFIVADEPHE